MIPDISFADEEFYSGKKLRIIYIIPKTIAKFLEIFMLIFQAASLFTLHEFVFQTANFFVYRRQKCWKNESALH